MVDVNVDLVKYKPMTRFSNDELVVVIGGKDVYPQLGNSLCRVALTEILTYSFRDNVVINKNTSVAFNNAYVMNAVGMIPIPIEVTDKRTIITMTIDVTNDVSPTRYVTSRDIIMHVNGVESTLYQYEQLPAFSICELAPNQELSLSATASINNGHNGDSWSNVKNAFSIPDEETSIVTLTFRGCYHGNIHSMFVHCCDILLIKIGSIKAKILSAIDVDEDLLSYTIILNNENATIGGIITHELQSHKSVTYCGFSQPDRLMRIIKLKLEIVEGTQLNNTIDQAMDILSAKIKKIKTDYLFYIKSNKI